MKILNYGNGIRLQVTELRYLFKTIKKKPWFKKLRKTYKNKHTINERLVDFYNTDNIEEKTEIISDIIFISINLYKNKKHFLNIYNDESVVSKVNYLQPLRNHKSINRMILMCFKLLDSYGYSVRQVLKANLKRYKNPPHVTSHIEISTSPHFEEEHIVWSPGMFTDDLNARYLF